MTMKINLASANGQWTGQVDVVAVKPPGSSVFLAGVEPLRRARDVSQKTPKSFLARVRPTGILLKLPDDLGVGRTLKLALTSAAPTVDCIVNVPEPAMPPTSTIDAVTASFRLEVDLEASSFPHFHSPLHPRNRHPIPPMAPPIPSPGRVSDTSVRIFRPILAFPLCR